MALRYRVPALAGLLLLSWAVLGQTMRTPGQGAPAPHAGDRRPVVRFLIGGAGAFDQRGFVKEYARALPNVNLVIVESTRGGGRLEELQRGEADLVINASQAAFLAYSGSLETARERFDKLRAISVLGIGAVHLVARRGAGIRTVTDLRGRSVGLGFRGSEAERAATAVLSAFGVGMNAVQVKYVPSDAAAGQLIDGSLDAMFLVSGYPAEAVRRGMTGGHSQLVPIDGAAAERLRARSGYYFATLVPAGAYPGQTEPVRTVGIRNLLVTHRDLDEQIGYELTRQFFVALPKLSALVSSLQQVDVHRASATSIPLHDGAARYYRERELFR